MVYFVNILYILLIFVLFSSLTIKIDNSISIRLFGIYIPIKLKFKKLKKNKINISQIIFFINSLKFFKIIKIRLNINMPFNAYTYSLYWILTFQVRQYLVSNMLDYKNDYYKITINDKYSIEGFILIKIRPVDVISLLLYEFRKVGKKIGASNT